MPATPRILPRLLAVLNDPDASSDDVVSIIKLEPTLAAQVLRLSNSSHYAFATPSHTLDEAFGRLGMREIYKLAASAVSMSFSTEPLPAYGLEAQEMWETAVACAVSMEKLSVPTDVDPAEGYSIGLFHNIGKIVIARRAAQAMGRVFEMVERERIEQTVAERTILGMDHVTASALLLEHWQFPESMVAPIRWQYQPMDCPEDWRVQACMVHLSLYVVGSVGRNHGRSAWAFTLNPEALRPLRIGENELQVCMLEVAEELKRLRAMMPTGGR